MLRGLGDCRVRAGQRVARPRRRRLVDGRLQRHVGGSQRAADAGVRRLPRRRTASRVPTAGSLRPGGRRRPVRPAGRAGPRVLHAVDAVQRLEPVGPARPAHDERPALLPRRRRISCGGSRPSEAPRLYTEADGWRPLRIWGMGIASQDVTGDGYPEVFLTSQGDNKLQTLADGPEPRRRTRTSRSNGASPPTARSPAATCSRRPRGTPSSQTSTTTASLDLFVAKGNVEAQDEYADARSEQPVARPGRRHVRRRRPTRRASSATSGPAARAVVDLNLDGLLDLVVVNRASSPTLWRNVGRGDAEQPAPMGQWIAVRPAPAGAERRCDRRVGRGAAGDRTVVREVDRRRRPCRRPDSDGSTLGLGDADEREVRVQWPDGETGPWMTVDGRTSSSTIERGATATPWTPRSARVDDRRRPDAAGDHVRRSACAPPDRSRSAAHLPGDPARTSAIRGCTSPPSSSRSTSWARSGCGF